MCIFSPLDVFFFFFFPSVICICGHECIYEGPYTTETESGVSHAMLFVGHGWKKNVAKFGRKLGVDIGAQGVMDWFLPTLF